MKITNLHWGEGTKTRRFNSRIKERVKKNTFIDNYRGLSQSLVKLNQRF